MQFAQRHRLTIATLVVACLAVVIISLVDANSSSTLTAAAAAPVMPASPVVDEATTTPPDWLVRWVQPLLNRYTGGKADAVRSLDWVKTTWGAYETAVGGGGGGGGGGGDKARVKPAYVVVARGKFTSEVGGKKDGPIAVTTVVMTFDGTSEKPATIDALYKASSFNETGLGGMQALTLPADSE